MPNTLWIILGLLALIAAPTLLFIVIIYNKLVTRKNRYLNAFAQIEVQLKRRYDLIPNLVETVKGYMTHERETLEAVVNARNTAASALAAASSNPSDPAAITTLGASQNALTSAMTSLMAVVEAYPNLKADTHMSALQEELTSTENKVAFARQSYNDSVTTYNIARQSFPTILLAPMMGHAKDAAFLDFDDAQITTVPQVNL